MAGVASEDCGNGCGVSSEHRCLSGDSIAEWRSLDQVENGTPSTSPSYWDTDDDDDDCGPKPADLFGKFTWKIENFSTINKRELRSNAFEVGGYKWYILIYPQGCDVCNHLSLFLCVADHDKLLPGWSHFAQFTISVINKDIKKSKYSDTLHRFWKKEHDWGWKKFMELSKVYDGFINSDALLIKAQVQVIREKAHRLFRCLDCQYRRELIRVYLSNVEQICRRSIEEKISKLGKLIEDKIRWPSLRSFWMGTTPNARWRMSSDKCDAILKLVVKHFFVEKEVTSTLVMDSLYSGLKALEYQSKSISSEIKFPDLEKLPPPMVCVDNDMFVLAGDVLLLLERAVKEPLPHHPLPPKDDKCSQNRTKDGSSGEEFSKDSVERDERRLMELGRRTVEIFVLFHIFSRIEVSYEEAVALIRQEELIREEEAAGHAENEHRTKRGVSEKDKRSKKKQAKQKRNSRKGKDKYRNDNSDAVHNKLPQESPSDDSILDDFTSKKEETIAEKIDTPESASDVSDNGNVVEALQPDLDDRNTSSVNWDACPSEIIPAAEVSGSDISNRQIEKRIYSAFDDSSSTCSTDSVPSVVLNGPCIGSSSPNNKVQTTPNRGKNNRDKESDNRVVSAHKVTSAGFAVVSDSGPSFNVASCKVSRPESDAIELPFKNEVQSIYNHLLKKEEEVASTHQDSSVRDETETEKVSKLKIKESPSLSSSVEKFIVAQQTKQYSEAPAQTAVTMASSSTSTTDVVLASSSAELSSTRNSSSRSLPQVAVMSSLESKLAPVASMSKPEVLKHNPPSKSPGGHPALAVSRPSNASLISAPASTPVSPLVSTVQSVPLPSCSASAASRLGSDPSPSAPSYIPQSYRNAIIGKSATGMNATIANNRTARPHSHANSSFMTSPLLSPHPSVRTDQMPVRSGFTFGSAKPEGLNKWQLSRDDTHLEATSSSGRYSSDLVADFERFGICGRRKNFSSDFAYKPLPQAQGLVADEFPHLDIINDLLDDENGGRTSKALHHTFSRQYSFPFNNSTMDIASFGGSGQFDQCEQPYDDGFGSTYVSPSSSLQSFSTGQFSQVDLSAYSNCQFEGVMQNQWPYPPHSDLSLLNLGYDDTTRYSYQLPDYSSLVSSVNGYMYRPGSRP